MHGPSCADSSLPLRQPVTFRVRENVPTGGEVRPPPKSREANRHVHLRANDLRSRPQNLQCAREMEQVQVDKYMATCTLSFRTPSTLTLPGAHLSPRRPRCNWSWKQSLRKHNILEPPVPPTGSHPPGRLLWNNALPYCEGPWTFIFSMTYS